MKGALISVLAFAIAGHTYACSCVEIRGLKESDIVFAGRVLKIDDLGSQNKINIDITFELYEVKKEHPKADTLIVNLPCLYGSCCGIDMRVGEEYNVFAKYTQNGLSTSLCTKTALLKK